MKHAAVLYTCIGLMGAAAVTGFADYTHASRAGLLKDLYSEEKATGSSFIPVKTVDINDYSRGPIEEVQVAEQQEEMALKAQPKKPKKVKKIVPPPPPPPDAPAPPPPPGKPGTPPPPPPKTVAAVTTSEVPPAPPATEAVETPPAPPAPEVTEVKTVSLKSFSRAPLSRKSIVKKKGQ